MVREYTAEFKLEAVKLANEQRKAGQTITKTAKDLGIKGGLLGKWIKKHNEKSRQQMHFQVEVTWLLTTKRGLIYKARVTRERDI
uniref:transposase n=1 Tax=Wolbachia endosymbiont (group A) of Acrocera orbiculus TaxID=2953971 RepID=UPI0022262B13|nr:transposase [Wolbachia endosymbiont (group A) of Acrocera orbiculus]